MYLEGRKKHSNKDVKIPEFIDNLLQESFAIFLSIKQKK